MESTPTEDAEGHAIVRVLAVVLERLVSANSHLEATSGSVPQEQTHFHAQRAPAIGILQYLERIHKYASCSKECFILALIYIDRLIQMNNFLLTELNVHRVVITAVLLAAKFFDDAYYNNAYYAKVGGVLVEEINNLEVQFLFKIDFSLRVLPEVFEKYRGELVSHSSDMDMARIANSTDDELFSVPAPAPQEQVCLQDVTVVEPQVPLSHSYVQVGEFMQPIAAYNTNPTQAVAAVAPLDGSASHYPIQALQQSVTASGPGAQAVAVAQQQQTTMNLEPVYHPFPVLAPQVSAHRQAQAPPAQNPTELDLVGCYHQNNAMQAPIMAPVPQDTTLYQQQQQYNKPCPTLNQGFVQAPAVSQGQVTAQQRDVYFRAAEAALYEYNTNAAAVHRATQQPMVPNHPEITPSPPPQPPINQLVGAPLAAHHLDAYHLGYPVDLTNTSVAYAAASCNYSTPADAALGLHSQPQLLPSQPIAIGSQSNNGCFPPRQEPLASSG